MINISARPPANLSLFGFKSSRKGGGGGDSVSCSAYNNNNNNNNNNNTSFKELVGVRADKILLDMQKAVISSTLNIARSFKVLTAQDLWTGQTFTHNFLGF